MIDRYDLLFAALLLILALLVAPGVTRAAGEEVEPCPLIAQATWATRLCE